MTRFFDRWSHIDFESFCILFLRGRNLGDNSIHNWATNDNQEEADDRLADTECPVFDETPRK